LRNSAKSEVSVEVEVVAFLELGGVVVVIGNFAGEVVEIGVVVEMGAVIALDVHLQVRTISNRSMTSS